jgi:hypothetical protein
MEAAAGMLKDGHNVTVLAGGKELVEIENQGAHNMMNQQNVYNNHPNFTYALETTVRSISGERCLFGFHGQREDGSGGHYCDLVRP